MREWESNTYFVGSEACFSFEMTGLRPDTEDSFRCAGINEAGRRLLTALNGTFEVWGEEGTGGLDEDAFRAVLDTGSERTRRLWIGSERRGFRARLRREGPRVVLGLTPQDLAEGSLRRRQVEGARRIPVAGTAASGQAAEAGALFDPVHQLDLPLDPDGTLPAARVVPAPAVHGLSFASALALSAASQRLHAVPSALDVTTASEPPLPGPHLQALRLGEPRPVLDGTPPRAVPAVTPLSARTEPLRGLAREVIWELDVQTGAYRWGETLRSVLGWRPEEAVDWRWSKACVHPSERSRISASFRQALESGARLWSSTFRFRRPDGSYLPLHTRAVIDRNAEGRPLRLVGCLVDLTETQEMESRQARENELRERFIGILGHDLRTPLNAISLSAQTLRKRSPLNWEQQEMVGRIQSSAARMERMIRDILDLTRARLGGGIPIRPNRCDPHGLTRRVIAEARAVYPDHALRFECHGSGRLLADVERLEQAVANLIANACQYGPTGRPITVVSTLETVGWRLSVHNWGPVIPDVRPDELFEPFRSRRRQDRNPEGLGLGLYIAREIASAHGGRISVTSSEEAGTRFWLEVPGT